MARHRQQHQGNLLGHSRLRSPVRVLLVVAVVSVIIGTHGQFLDPVCRAISLSGRLVRLRTQYQRLAERNEQLAEVVSYLKTEEGQELAARSELGALKKGERLIICQPPPSSVATGPVSIAQRVYRSLSRAHEVWRKSASYLGELAACLFATSEPSLRGTSEDCPTSYEAKNAQP